MVAESIWLVSSLHIDMCQSALIDKHHRSNTANELGVALETMADSVLRNLTYEKVWHIL